jgi:hypothetical protein
MSLKENGRHFLRNLIKRKPQQPAVDKLRQSGKIKKEWQPKELWKFPRHLPGRALSGWN